MKTVYSAWQSHNTNIPLLFKEQFWLPAY